MTHPPVRTHQGTEPQLANTCLYAGVFLGSYCTASHHQARNMHVEAPSIPPPCLTSPRNERIPVTTSASLAAKVPGQCHCPPRQRYQLGQPVGGASTWACRVCRPAALDNVRATSSPSCRCSATNSNSPLCGPAAEIHSRLPGRFTGRQLVELTLCTLETGSSFSKM